MPYYMLGWEVYDIASTRYVNKKILSEIVNEALAEGLELRDQWKRLMPFLPWIDNDRLPIAWGTSVSKRLGLVIVEV